MKLIAVFNLSNIVTIETPENIKRMARLRIDEMIRQDPVLALSFHREYDVEVE